MGTFAAKRVERGFSLSKSLLDRVPNAGVRGRLTPGARLSEITWFRVGGPAELLFQPADAEDLAFFLAQLPLDIPVTAIGLGSNLLIRDGGLPGVTIRLSAKGFGFVERVGETRLRAGCAVPDKKLADAALAACLGGFAFYHGIPGGLGGALRMNAGANGSETCDRVVAVEAIDRQGNFVTLSKAEMGYTYRHSSVPDELIFVGATFEGEPCDQASITEAMAAVAEHREANQPIKDKTGGSTFKNPPGTSAWKEIDKAGCRGLMIGDAQVSEKHCNFLINRGAATAHDLELLGETVRARVLETSGIHLEWEIKRLGLAQDGEVVSAFLQSPA